VGGGRVRGTPGRGPAAAPGLELPATPHQRRRVAVLEGFSLHADTAVHGNDRAGLGRLCRYGARGPVSERRLEKLEDGRYRYTPKKGVAFTVTAAALVKRLVALLPPPPPEARRDDDARLGVPAASDTSTVSPTAGAQAHRLGDAAPPHLRYRRAAMPLRWPSQSHRPPLHPQGRRGAPRPNWACLVARSSSRPKRHRRSSSSRCSARPPRKGTRVSALAPRPLRTPARPPHNASSPLSSLGLLAGLPRAGTGLSGCFTYPYPSGDPLHQRACLAGQGDCRPGDKGGLASWAAKGKLFYSANGSTPTASFTGAVSCD